MGGIGQAQTIYQTDRKGLIATDIQSGKSKQLMHQNMDYPIGLWVDTQEAQLYWADLFAETIMTASTDTTQPDMRSIINSVETGLGWPTDVVVNPETETIYFTVREGSESEKESALISMNYEGQVIDTLLNEDDGLDWPNALVMDNVNNIIYVADAYEGVFRVNPYNEEISGPLGTGTDEARGIALDQQSGKLYIVTTNDEIQRMNLDGSGMEVLIDSGFEEGQRIKLDVEAGKMYWTSEGDIYDDEVPGKIQRANLDGSQVEDVFTEAVDAFNGLFLDTSNNEMYVIRRYTNAILKMNMDGTDVTTLYDGQNSGLIDPGKMVYNENTDELIWIRDEDDIYGQPYKVVKTAADGSGELEVLFSNEDEINSIEIDEENERLFWAISEGYEAQIYMGELDGSNPQMLTSISSSSTTRIPDIEYKNATDEVFWLVDGRERIEGIHKMTIDSDSSTRISSTQYLTDLAYSATNDSLYAYGYDNIIKLAIDGSGEEAVITEGGRPGDLAIYEDRLYWGFNGGIFSSDLAGNDSVMVSNNDVGENRSFVFGPEMIFTSTKDEPTAVSMPNRISLEQNYPNPFNPSTNISFSLPKTSNISLKVYNMLGQEVATIFEGRVGHGEHSFKFDAGNLASGVYLYRLEAGEFSQAKKFTLIK